MPADVFLPGASRDTARRAFAAALRGVGIETSDLDARVLVGAACGVDHAGLIGDPQVPIAGAAPVLKDFLARRLASEPVSRILGRREFWGLSFAVTPDVLDPRPETEGVVAAAIDALGGRRADALRVLDLGTGSGAILCALLRELPGAIGLGVDRSIGACRVAAANVASLGFASRASIVCADWARSIGAHFDLVVANPPYVARGTIGGLDRAVRDHDPLSSLDGGDDGLDAFRAIVPGLRAILAGDGLVVFECGSQQGRSVADMVRGVGLGGVMVYRDLAGLERVVVGRDAAPPSRSVG